MIEVADIFREFGPFYRQSRKLPLRMLKTMRAIEVCRTAELGGHVDECNSCGHLKISYNSCRNRHCPKCQSLAKENWLAERRRDLLPVQYFHIVLTIPDLLNPLALRNQKEIYTILFKAGSETLLELGKDPKYLGADIGFISILHTWGQNLMDHPHLHCIVPGGGLSFEGSRWISSRKKFFVPVKVLSRLFQGKFLAYLKKAYHQNQLQFDGSINSLKEPQNFQVLLNELYQKEWVTYCKPPFGSPLQVLEYLGRYTHRVAISNQRISNFKNGEVTFRWRDYKDGNKNKLMTIDAQEFIRRFLLHILPDNFVKIRHYGLFSNRHRKTKLKRCKEILGVTLDEQEESTSASWQEVLLKLTGIDHLKCPFCEEGMMVQKEVLYPKRYIPIGKKCLIA